MHLKASDKHCLSTHTVKAALIKRFIFKNIKMENGLPSKMQVVKFIDQHQKKKKHMIEPLQKKGIHTGKS